MIPKKLLEVLENEGVVAIATGGVLLCSAVIFLSAGGRLLRLLLMHLGKKRYGITLSQVPSESSCKKLQQVLGKPAVKIIAPGHGSCLRA